MNTSTEEKAKSCLFPGCLNKARLRGLCGTHYSTAIKLVKDKKVTWNQLERAGKILVPTKKTGISDWFLAAKTHKANQPDETAKT